jgi:hypothetical protein
MHVAQVLKSVCEVNKIDEHLHLSNGPSRIFYDFTGVG